MIALLIGRFQPLHNGHLEYIKRILKENDYLKIVIGSSQEKLTTRNPFSVKQRINMLKMCFKKEGIMNRIRIYYARDFPDDDKKWLENIVKKVGEFDVVYAGENKIVYKIFNDAGYKVKKCRRIKGICGTKIRERMKKGKEWKHLVPDCIYEIAKNFKFNT